MNGEGRQQRGRGSRGAGLRDDETGLEAYMEVERPGGRAWRGLGRRGPTPFPAPGAGRVLHLVLAHVPRRVLPSQQLVCAKCTLSQSPVSVSQAPWLVAVRLLPTPCPHLSRGLWSVGAGGEAESTW